MTWGAGPFVKTMGWGSWTDLVLNSTTDAFVASAMYFYAVPAMNNAFTTKDKANDPNSTLNPDLNLSKLLGMFAAVSASGYLGRRHRINKAE
jgi:hypothetical protein